MATKLLVTGGVRSGKSRFAEQEAARFSKEGRVLYIATAKIFDWEMQERVRKHQQRRPATWDTYEGHTDLGSVIREQGEKYETILLDCITVMLTNLLFDQIGDQDPDTLTKVQVKDLEMMAVRETEALVQGILDSKANVVVVTNELGLGVVPERLLGRVFRDMAGQANQILAAALSDVVFMVSGLPWYLKGGSEK